jgi:hypothetical protein
MNTLDDTPAFSAPMPMEPNVPDPTMEGMAIEEKVNTPAPSVAPMEGNESATNGAMVESSLTGGSPFDGALSGNIPV